MKNRDRLTQEDWLRRAQGSYGSRGS